VYHVDYLGRLAAVGRNVRCSDDVVEVRGSWCVVGGSRKVSRLVSHANAAFSSPDDERKSITPLQVDPESGHSHYLHIKAMRTKTTLHIEFMTVHSQLEMSCTPASLRRESSVS
jgi:hypothetical protein